MKITENENLYLKALLRNPSLSQYCSAREFFALEGSQLEQLATGSLTLRDLFPEPDVLRRARETVERLSSRPKRDFRGYGGRTSKSPKRVYKVTT